MLLDRKNIYYYLFAFSLIVLANYFGSKFKTYLAEKNDEYDMIKKYLLNDDSHLEGSNKTKLWIHSKYEINSRKWKDFYSRNTTDLNQPYIHLTIKTVIDHCSNDFNICLIDDETFSKIIPDWDIDISKLTDPLKSMVRELGMMKLLYIYGGIIVPNTFICTRNLNSLFQRGTSGNRPFVCESINRSCDLMKTKNSIPFIPNTKFMGSKKNDSSIREMIEFLEEKSNHFFNNSEYSFLGELQSWCLDAVKTNKINLIGGEFIGIKTIKHKPILMEDLMEENYLDFYKDKYGIYIPGDEILSRTKYQWFSVMELKELLKTNMIITKHLIVALGDANNDNIYSKQDTTERVTLSL